MVCEQCCKWGDAKVIGNATTLDSKCFETNTHLTSECWITPPKLVYSDTMKGRECWCWDNFLRRPFTRVELRNICNMQYTVVIIWEYRYSYTVIQHICCLFLVLKATSEESDVILQTYQTALFVLILAFTHLVITLESNSLSPQVKILLFCICSSPYPPVSAINLKLSKQGSTLKFLHFLAHFNIFWWWPNFRSAWSCFGYKWSSYVSEKSAVKAPIYVECQCNFWEFHWLCSFLKLSKYFQD